MACADDFHITMFRYHCGGERDSIEFYFEHYCFHLYFLSYRRPTIRWS